MQKQRCISAKAMAYSAIDLNDEKEVKKDKNLHVKAIADVSGAATSARPARVCMCAQSPAH